MRIGFFGEKRRIYFIGIGGVSMSALAKMLLSSGYRVSGYDAFYGRQVQILKSMGVSIAVGEEEDFDNLSRAEVVVYTDAISQEDRRLCFAQNQAKLVMSRGKLLAILCEQFSKVISIAGSHGKTTCTAMCAHVFSEMNVPFAAHIGGEDLTFDNFLMTGKDFFVTEACEYKKNLSYITADSAILLNVDNDHLDCYQGEDDLKEHFFSYLNRAKLAFICADDKKCKEYICAGQKNDLITFGVEDIILDYTAMEVKSSENGCSFSVYEYGKRLCRVQLSVLGKHNVLNALAVFAVLRSYGFDEKEISKGLKSFQGVKRRFEKLGRLYGAIVIADYAHHPREIEATIAVAKESMQKRGGKLHVIFQPHTYSRTKLLFEEFVSVLTPIANLVVYATFGAREKYDEEGSAKKLAEAIGRTVYVDNAFSLEVYLRNTIKAEDTVLFLGAGDVYTVAGYLIKNQK